VDVDIREKPFVGRVYLHGDSDGTVPPGNNGDGRATGTRRGRKSQIARIVGFGLNGPLPRVQAKSGSAASGFQGLSSAGAGKGKPVDKGPDKTVGQHRPGNGGGFGVCHGLLALGLR
jgi:hypothetical protein